MKGYNHVTLIGRVNKPEISNLQNSVLLRFSLAVTYYKKVSEGFQEETDWFNIKAFDRFNPESVEQGALVHISGRLKPNVFESQGVKKYSMDIIADDIIVLSRKGAGNAAGTTAPGMAAATTRPAQKPLQWQDPPAADTRASRGDLSRGDLSRGDTQALPGDYDEVPF